MFKIVAMVVVGLIAWSYIRKAMASLGDAGDVPDDIAPTTGPKVEPEDIYLPK